MAKNMHYIEKVLGHLGQRATITFISQNHYIVDSMTAVTLLHAFHEMQESAPKRSPHFLCKDSITDDGLVI